MASLSPDVELLKLHWYSMEADLTEERYHGMRLDLGKLYARSPWARNTLAMTFSNPEGDVDRIPQLLESATGEVFSALADVLCVRRDRSVPTQLHAAGTSLLVRPCAWQAFRPGAEVVVETILRNNPNVDLSELVENGGLDVRVAGRSAYLFELLRDKGVLDLATAVSSAEGATTDWLHSQGVDTTERWNAVFALLEADVTVPLKEVPALALSMA